MRSAKEITVQPDMKSTLIFAASQPFNWALIMIPFAIGAGIAFFKSDQKKISDRLASAFCGGIAGICVVGAFFYVEALFRGGGSMDD